MIWNGGAMVEYDGQPNPKALIEYLAAVAKGRPAGGKNKKRKKKKGKKDQKKQSAKGAGKKKKKTKRKGPNKGGEGEAGGEALAGLTARERRQHECLHTDPATRAPAGSDSVSDLARSMRAANGGGPHVLALTPAEQRCGAPLDATVKVAEMLLRSSGYVVLRNAIPEAALRAFREALEDGVEASMAHVQKEKTPEGTASGGFALCTGEGAHCFTGWHERRRFKVAPTLTGPFAADDIINNGALLPILKAAFKGDVRLMTFATDANAVGSVSQGIHRDVGIEQLQPDSYAEHTPSVLVANIAARDVTLEDGPMELWPGTHMHDLPGLDFDVLDDGNTTEGAEFATLLPHTKVLMKAGDILLRDPHMLHRGTAYAGADQYRLLASLIYRGADYDGSRWGYMDVRRFNRHQQRAFEDVSHDGRQLLL